MEMRLTMDAINSSLAVISATPSYVTKGSQLLMQNVSGSNSTIQLEIARTASGNASVDTDSTIFIHAPFTNLTDWTIAFQASTIYLYQAGGTLEGILGQEPPLDASDFTSITVDSVVKSMVFTANAGKLLWDYDGFNIGVTL